MTTAIDLRPRIILHPPGAGAIVLVVDPSSPTAGTVAFPVLGTVPYDVTYGIPTVIHLHTFMGDVPITIDPTNLSGDTGTVPIPLLGDVPYEVVLGPTGIAEDQLFGAGMAGWLLPVALLGLAFVLLKGK